MARRRKSSGTRRRRRNMGYRRRSYRRRRSNPRTYNRRRRQRRSNATRIVVVSPRRSNRRRRRSRRANPYRRNRRSYRRRRNPALFGQQISGRRALTMIGGGLTGVLATKVLPGLLPAGLVPGGGGVAMRLVVSGVAAFAAGWAGSRFVGTDFGDAVLFGGLMQTGSLVINAIMPGLRIMGQPLALSGLGELMPGQFVVPQNPLRLPPAPPAQARVNMNGLSRSYGVAY